MLLDVTESVTTQTAPEDLWQAVLEPSAVFGLLGDAADVRAYTDPADPTVEGHTFRIKGIGGGVFHAMIAERDELSSVAYAVWRHDEPRHIGRLTYSLAPLESSGVEVSAAVLAELPIEEILGGFAAPAALAAPLITPWINSHTSKRLRTQLEAVVRRAAAMRQRGV